MTKPGNGLHRRDILALAAAGVAAAMIPGPDTRLFPMEAALIDAAGIKGMVLVEPGDVRNYTEEQIAMLAKVPVLVVFGDYLGDNW